MSKAEAAKVYFDEAKKTTDRRHKKYLLDKGIEAMGDAGESIVRARDRMILAEGVMAKEEKKS